MKWFFPSFYGDFRLEQAGEKKSVLVVEKATAAEKTKRQGSPEGGSSMYFDQ